MAFTSYTPDKIEATENMANKTVVTAEHWNNILNMLIAQGNATAQEVYDLIAQLAATTGADDVGAATITGVAGTTVQTVMAGLKALIDLCYTSATTDTLLAQKETIASANQLIKTITFNSSDGKFTITKQDGSQSIIDTAFEKTAVNFAYNPTTQALDLTLADGSVTSVSLSAFITENEFLDSDQIDFSVNNHAVTATIKSGCITEAMLASATITSLIGYKDAAQTSATAAAASEANALAYKNAAASSATDSANSATASATSAANALAYKNAAASSATDSANSATASATSAANAKTSETNAASSAAAALDYKNQAGAIVGDKVISFNGRKDVVTPATGDYTAEMVGAAEVTHAATHATGGSDALTPADIGALCPTITVTVDSGSTVTATCGGKTLTGTSNGTCTLNLTSYGTWTVTATLSGKTASGTVIVDTVKQYAIELAYVKIYGISWSGGPSTAWTRTDDAAGFSDPVPALSNGTGSSPFDNCYPWNGMVKESRTGGVMVKIPKFWFKWTKSGSTLKLQIADKAVNGFSVSPAHMDRGDGKGERDYVYVGRYHCNSSYLSATGSSPVANITRSSARTSIHAKGSTIWQMDYATRLTIWMLYLVEFANTDSQACIGYGCGDNSAAAAMGYTDAMTYHTGTTQSSRTAYGLGTQYRYIEGLWDNVYDWMDGCYYSSSGMSVIKNPANFSDTANGTVIGTPTSGYPSAMSLSSVSGFEWCVFPTTASGSTTTYFPDNWSFNASNPCLYAGGSYSQNLNCGAFCVCCAGASGTSANIGCRLQELP